MMAYRFSGLSSVVCTSSSSSDLPAPHETFEHEKAIFHLTTAKKRKLNREMSLVRLKRSTYTRALLLYFLGVQFGLHRSTSGIKLSNLDYFKKLLNRGEKRKPILLL